MVGHTMIPVNADQIVLLLLPFSFRSDAASWEPGIKHILQGKSKPREEVRQDRV